MAAEGSANRPPGWCICAPSSASRSSRIERTGASSNDCSTCDWMGGGRAVGRSSGGRCCGGLAVTHNVSTPWASPNRGQDEGHQTRGTKRDRVTIA